MTHESDLTYLGRSVYTTWTFLWFLHHAWSVDRFQALRWKRIKRFELKSAITLLLMIMCPLQILYDVLCSVIKYEEGFFGSSLGPPFQIFTKPYENWTPEHKSWVGPIDYVLCANFSVQTGLLFLLQSFWNYLANNLTNTTFMGSFEFKSYIVYSIFSAITFPFLQYTFRGDPLRMELVPQVVYGVFQIIVAALGIRSDSRFKRLLAKNAASAQPHVYQKLEYFKDMNRILTGALLIASTSLIVISVDGLTAAQFLSRKKWVADFLITNVSFGLYMVFLSLLLIFYPSKNLASDTATIGKNSSFSKRSINQVSQSSEKWGNNKNGQLFNPKPESSDSSFYVDMGEDSIYNASAAPSVHNFKTPPSLSQFVRSDSLDGATCVQISPISPVSPMSQFSTPPLFSPSTSSLQSPRSPPPHANTYPPLTPIQTAHTYNHSRAMESDVIRPNAMNPPSLFSPLPLKATTPSGSEFSFSRKNSVSSSEVPLIASRENSLGSIEISASTAPPTPRKSPNRPPSISTPVIKITRSSRESLKDDEIATVSLAQKLNIRKSTAVVAPIIPPIEEEEPPIKGYVGSGAGIPPKTKPQSPTTKPQSPTAKPQSPTAKPQSPQHRKRSSSSSLTKNAQFRGAIVAMNQPQTPPPGTQRKRSSSNVSLTTRNAIIRGASAPSLRSQNNTTKRSSLKSTSSSASSSNTISGTSIKGSSVSTTTSRTAKRSSPPTSTYSKMTRVQNSSSPMISTTRTNIRANSTRTTQPPLKKESSFTKQRPPPLLSSSSFKAKDGTDLYVSPASTPGSGDIGVAW